MTATSPADVRDDQVNERADERGYVLATTALLLIPLMIFAALAVDVGGWYSRANQVQRASDAAALAAVIWMPDDTKALQVALETAKQNGFDAADADVDVQLSIIDSQSVRVDITAKGDTYFGGVVQQGDVNLHRFATAQFILPVPMGNPSSQLGTGDVGGSIGNENMWLAVSSYCTGRQQGDMITARFQGDQRVCKRGTIRLGASGNSASTQNPSTGTNSVLNPQYKEEGHYVVITMPKGPTGTVYDSYDVQIYEPGFCRPGDESWWSDPNYAHAGTIYDDGTKPGPTILHTRLYRGDDTLITDTDNLVPAMLWPDQASSHIAWPATSCGWQTAYTIGSSAPRGRWLLNVDSAVNTEEIGINTFGVRVVPTTGANAGQPCVQSSTNTLCPTVSAKDRLSIYAPDGLAPVAGDPAVFYLAKIDEVHKGKTLEVTLFDPGEGMANLQIIAPDGTRPAFSFETIDNDLTPTAITTAYSSLSASGMVDLPLANSTASCNVSGIGAVHCLDVLNNKFQNRTVRLSIPLPSTYSCASLSNGCWWRIRYQPDGGSVTDRTVWSVRVIGDPVRLSE